MLAPGGTRAGAITTCQSWQDSRAQAKVEVQAAQAGMDSSKVHSSTGTLALFSYSAHPAQGEKPGAAKVFHIFI